MSRRGGTALEECLGAGMASLEYRTDDGCSGKGGRWGDTRMGGEERGAERTSVVARPGTDGTLPR